MSAVLQEHGREHVVLERRRVAERWRTERWESMRFQFPNWALELPGYSYSGDDPDGFAHWREVLRVIEQYAASTHAPVREHTEVTALRAARGRLRAGRAGRADPRPSGRRCDRAVPAAAHPAVVRGRRADGPADRSDAVPSARRTCLTVPCSWSVAGRPVARSATNCCVPGVSVFLSVSRHRRVPRRFRGKDVTWWLERMGRFDQTIDSFPGRQWPPSVVVTGVNGGYDVNVRQMAADGIRRARAGTWRARRQVRRRAERERCSRPSRRGVCRLRGRCPRARCRKSRPATSPRTRGSTASGRCRPRWTEIDSLDLQRENIAAIIWATGYDYDYGWLQAPVLDGHGRPLQQRGSPRFQGSTSGPALDAHVQVRPVVRRRSRRRVPRRTHGFDDLALTTATPPWAEAAQTRTIA